jgi:periplasmic protein TonB
MGWLSPSPERPSSGPSLAGAAAAALVVHGVALGLFLAVPSRGETKRAAAEVMLTLRLPARRALASQSKTSSRQRAETHHRPREARVPSPVLSPSLPAPRQASPVERPLTEAAEARGESPTVASADEAGTSAEGAASSPEARGSAGSTEGARVGEGPRLLEAPPPKYPHAARVAGEEGRVRLMLLVGTDGRVERIELARSSGHESLDRAALDAVSRWRFEPASRGGRAVASWVVIPVAFSLELARTERAAADSDHGRMGLDFPRSNI